MGSCMRWALKYDGLLYKVHGLLYERWAFTKGGLIYEVDFLHEVGYKVGSYLRWALTQGGLLHEVCSYMRWALVYKRWDLT